MSKPKPAHYPTSCTTCRRDYPIGQLKRIGAGKKQRLICDTCNAKRKPPARG